MGTLRKTTVTKPEEVERIVEKKIFVPRFINSYTTNYAGTNMSGMLPSSAEPPAPGTAGSLIGVKMFNLGLMGSPTGCGMGIFFGWTGWPHTQMTPEDWAFVKDLIKQRCKQSGWNCLMTTMGDNFKTYESILTKLGFVKIHSFHNLNHGANYQQHVFQLNVSSMP